MSNPDLNLFWENWLLVYPEKLEEVKQARELILAFQYKKYPHDEKQKRKTWAAIERMTEQDESNPEEKLKIFPFYPDQNERAKPTNNTFFKIVVKWAAVFMGILLMSLLIINQIDNQLTEGEEIIVRVNKINPKGQKSKISLPDGSIVYLNGASNISYAPNFSTSKREIILSGEAFFEVAKDSLRPFVVIADKLITTALGTSFNIKAYPEDQEVSISLLTGGVSVQQQDSVDPALFLNPGEAAGLSHAGILIRKEFNYEQDILWKDGILYFKETRLKEAFQRLEKWYGVSFNLQNLPRRPVIITGKFDNENLNNVLLSLSYTSNFTYSIKNEEVVVFFK
ncbi:MAG: FecR domain-containing protein [Cyclobacteriaceae bacterium]